MTYMLNKSFLEKNIVLMGLILSVVLLIIAGIYYPGGSPKDIHSVGYSWTDNYISNLLEYNAVNGMENKTRLLGVFGVVLMGLSSGFAFVRLARKIILKKFSIVIKYVGLLLIVFSILITIPSFHNLMVTLSSTATLLLVFYVTILLLKSKLQILKFTSLSLLIIFYGAAYMYFTKSGVDYLPIVQKIIHILQFIWIVQLEYFTSKTDFDEIKA